MFFYGGKKGGTWGQEGRYLGTRRAVPGARRAVPGGKKGCTWGQEARYQEARSAVPGGKKGGTWGQEGRYLGKRRAVPGGKKRGILLPLLIRFLKLTGFFLSFDILKLT